MEDADDALIVDHVEWERRLELAETRRQEHQLQTIPEPEPEAEHSTDILTRIKSCASDAWAWVKSKIWG